MRTIKYDVITAIIDYGVNMHPQTQMMMLGFEVEGYRQDPEHGCWWFEVSNRVGGLPEYVEEVEIVKVDKRLSVGNTFWMAEVS